MPTFSGRHSQAAEPQEATEAEADSANVDMGSNKRSWNSKRSQQDEESKRAQEAADRHSDQIKEIRALTSALDKIAGIAEQIRAQTEPKPSQPKSKGLTIGKFLRKWLTVVSVVIAAVFAAGQWSVMRGQLAEMQGSGKQTDQLIAQTERSADAAVRAADAVTKSANTEDSALKLTQAADISFVNFSVDPITDRDSGAITGWNIYTNWINVGPTTARHALAWVSSRNLTAQSSAKFNFSPNPGQIDRENPIDVGPKVTFTGIRAHVSTADVETMFKTGEKIFVGGGVIDSDIFGKKHHSVKCARLMLQGQDITRSINPFVFEASCGSKNNYEN